MTVRVLVTNDDGIEAAGIARLASVCHRSGYDVTVAAPSWDSSGASASLTGVSAAGRLQMERRAGTGAFEYLAPGRVFAVEAAPAMIVWAATAGAFGPPPDAVVSGVNAGRNTGRAILHSGTVGAALTGAAHGLAALAFSIDAPTANKQCATVHWPTADAVVERSLGWIDNSIGGPGDIPERRGRVLNVNVPNVELSRLTAFEEASLAPIGAVQARVTDASAGWVDFSFGELDDVDPGSDNAALARCAASYSVITVDCQATSGQWRPDDAKGPSANERPSR